MYFKKLYLRRGEPELKPVKSSSLQFFVGKIHQQQRTGSSSHSAREDVHAALLQVNKERLPTTLMIKYN